MSVFLPGESEPVIYWYMLYTVVNESGQDVEFYPTFDLVTDTLQVVVAGEDIHPAVVDAIKARIQELADGKGGVPLWIIDEAQNLPVELPRQVEIRTVAGLTGDLVHPVGADRIRARPAVERRRASGGDPGRPRPPAHEGSRSSPVHGREPRAGQRSAPGGGPAACRSCP